MRSLSTPNTAHCVYDKRSGSTLWVFLKGDSDVHARCHRPHTVCSPALSPPRALAPALFHAMLARAFHVCRLTRKLSFLLMHLVHRAHRATLQAMLDFVFGHGVQGLSNTTAGLLHSAQVGAPVHELHGAGAGDVDGSKPGSTKSLRTTFKENKTLCAAIRMANSYDMLLHGEAARIYNFNKAAMLHLV